jgi:hypothetical protein
LCAARYDEGMQRFTLYEMFAAFTAVSIGLGMVALAVQLNQTTGSSWRNGIPGGLVGGASVVTGSGFALLCNKSWSVGITVGLVTAFTGIVLIAI